MRERDEEEKNLILVKFVTLDVRKVIEDVDDYDDDNVLT